MATKTVGSTVKRARAQAGMSQRELGEVVGVKASHIAYIENDQRKPSMALMLKLAETLKVSARELLFLAHPEAKRIMSKK